MNWITNSIEDPITEEEGKFEGNLFLSTDSKMTVSIKADTPQGRKAGLQWAKRVYDRLLVSYGKKEYGPRKGSPDVQIPYKQVSTGTEWPLTCLICGEPAKNISGVSKKNNRPYNMVVCSTENKAHTKFI